MKPPPQPMPELSQIQTHPSIFQTQNDPSNYSSINQSCVYLEPNLQLINQGIYTFP
ncbi:hypothetical protein P154DRAFT_521714 [Amniculicola lignicola CBS 123094]|uniref:Uncharacterized protein n=1 Tax=Amniculicola lignicola CBS 123094 TaxID=1392246 RepID=A0A6A5WHL5_9PLEO|nr:hypothetical protein P154DRAFT_521714 [Amniculicola lignicola CBS 123094]